MRILILGGDGMIGHQIFQQLRSSHEVKVTLHGLASAYANFPQFNADTSYFNQSVTEFATLQQVFAEFSPDIIINAIGVVKQKLNEQNRQDVINAIQINALFPHQLAQYCEHKQIRLIHLSSDCIFSGQTGNYLEYDFSDADDVYGRTKYLGEVAAPGCLTLRTSTIGLELHPARRHGLLEWFLAQHQSINGFAAAIYSGVTTQELARVIEKIIIHHPNLSGLYHVASQPISKYELLVQLQQLLNRTDLVIHRENQFKCDRSLNSAALERAINYQAPSWPIMLSELAEQIKLREKNYVTG